VKAFTKLVTDITLRKQSSRSLNSNDDIKKYFEGWQSAEKPSPKARFLYSFRHHPRPEHICTAVSKIATNQEVKTNDQDGAAARFQGPVWE
jgi:hypothetical protein